MDIQKEREAFLKWHYEQYLLENPNIDIANAKYIYDYAHNNALVYQLRESHFTAWQEAKAQSEKALLEQFEINNKLVEQIEKLKADAPGLITITHERLQELIAIGVKAALEREQK